MERLTYWNDEYDCWSYRCASGDAAKRLAVYEDSGLTSAKVSEYAAEIKWLKSLLNKAYADLAIECCTCLHQDSDFCKNCSNCSGPGHGNDCLWEWRFTEEVQKV